MHFPFIVILTGFINDIDALVVKVFTVGWQHPCAKVFASEALQWCNRHCSRIGLQNGADKIGDDMNVARGPNYVIKLPSAILKPRARIT